MTYAASNLHRGQTYYWRVDERRPDGTVVPGPIWSFSVRPVFAKVDPNLVAWWKLDEEKSAYAADYSGNDYYGTFTGSPVWVDGYLGDGLKLNGSTDYVDFGTPGGSLSGEDLHVQPLVPAGQGHHQHEHHTVPAERHLAQRPDLRRRGLRRGRRGSHAALL